MEKRGLDEAFKTNNNLFLNAIFSNLGMMVLAASSAILPDNPSASYLWYSVPLVGGGIWVYNLTRLTSNTETMRHILLDYLKEDEKTCRK